MNWQPTQWNDDVNLKTLKGGLFYFNVPIKPGHVNSLVAPHKGIELGQTVNLEYQVKVMSGAPKFRSLDPNPGLLPNFRVMLQREGDILGNTGGYEHYRWWSNPECVDLKKALEDGKKSNLSIYLGQKHWSNVNGMPVSEAKEKFIECLKNLGHVQIVYGGGISFSHGINAVDGIARFKLFSFEIA